MASRKLNVLVYAGTGTTPESVRHCLLTLRRLLYPNYAVVPVTETVLLREPWQATCALLVIPGGADMGYSRVLNGAGNRRIAQYVRAGGRYLGLCAGGYYGSSRCEFEVGNKALEVAGRRELGLFRGTCRGGAYKGFAYHSEAGARAVQLTIHAEAFSSTTAAGSGGGGGGGGSSPDLPASAYCYYNGGGVFVDAAKHADAGVQVLASYPDDLAVSGGKGGQRAAVVYCPVGEGAALLTGPHPEFEPANLAEHPELPAYKELLRALHRDDEAGQARVRFLQACLVKLGLELGHGSAFQPRLTALHVTSLFADEVQELAYRWEEILSRKGDKAFVRGETDTFRVLLPDSGASAWPSAANVAATADDDGHGAGHTAAHLPFSASMALDLTDRALRYPKLGALVLAVANGTASADEQTTFRAILRAIAHHDEEADDADDDGSATNASVTLDNQSVHQWRDAWRKRRDAFDATIDAVYRAVGRSLLGHQDDVPALDDEVRQELWSALVHAWEHKRTQSEERARAAGATTPPAAGADDNGQAGRLLQLVDEVAGDDADDGTVKRIVVYERGWPSRIAAFDLHAYYQALARYRQSSLAATGAGGGAGGADGDDFEWGNQLMYAKVTTSTNTLLETNHKLLATLPTGFTFTATRQLAARGRGSNVWLAPEGQLILSTVINHPHRFGSGGSGGSTTLRPVVFIQYLAAVAVVEAIHGYAPGFDALNVKLKWPNDVYALDPTAAAADKKKTPAGAGADADPSSHRYLKIGGILSQCSFSNGCYQVVLGIGLNAVNRRPTTSLEALVPDALRAAVGAAPGQPVFRLEQLLAGVLVRLEALYKHFCRRGFAGDLERRYYRHWLHANQLVTLEAVDGAPRARVLGITPDWGLLQVAEVALGDAAAAAGVRDGADPAAERRTGRVWQLQSDENSFDYWKGLVRTKS